MVEKMLLSGKGFQMATTGTGAAMEFTGDIQAGSVNIAIINNDAANSGAGSRWNLVANPYPSYINANSSSGTNNVMDANDDGGNDVFDDSHAAYTAIYAHDGDGTYTAINNSTAAKYTNSGARTVTSTSSSTVGFGLQMIGSNYYGVGNEMIAYCFHSVTGYSKFGSYTGTGSTGLTVSTGFPVAFVMIKRTDGNSEWAMYDNTRSPTTTGVSGQLRANASDDEETNSVVDVDLTSTGFTIQTTDNAQNANGCTYAYMAFADKREYAYWLDQSGNNNDWTSNNLTESDISVDSPTNNFATMNPLDKDDSITVSEGNLKAIQSGVQHDAIRSTIATSTGKWYFEVRVADVAVSYTHLRAHETPEHLVLRLLG